MFAVPSWAVHSIAYAAEESTSSARWKHVRHAEMLIQIWLIRCVIGNPFRLAASPDPARLRSDGKILVSGSENGTTKVWHIASRRELFSLSVAADGTVNDVAFSPNGEFLAAAYTSHRENGVAVWRATPVANAP
jgi:WD40 repeat protein